MHVNRFVYFLGSGSKYNDDELRYSIRSVLKFHPDAQITVIGERPEWYSGEHHYVADSHNCAYVNKWRKIETACWLYDSFYAMDDDFFLMKPIQPVFYYSGKLARKAKTYKSEVGKYANMVIATCAITPGANNYFMHAPLPINSDEFIHISQQYPARLESPGLSARQIYATQSTLFESVEIQSDVKIHGKFDASKIAELPFFSIHNNFCYLTDMMESLYPTPSPNERDRG